ncbi:ODA11 [Symbiodinium natans]|uniref:ODA11 protein n=1 Tax=Symbiodinium natans TaxID=878477 RepID=A0A812NKE4_9DINO|nr:ODA11 [Symbiodinium natans]
MQKDPSRVNLFWKLSVPDLGRLEDIQLPPAAQLLPKVEEPHVTLLFFGGRDEKKAAQKACLPLEQFQNMNSILADLEGESVCFSAHAIFIHPQVVFASVSLPDDLPCDGDHPNIKFRVSPSADGSIVRSILQQLQRVQENGLVRRIDLDPPISLMGTVEMETGAPRSNQIRQTHVADEDQGTWVYVKKHSHMKCAVVHFPSMEIRDAVLVRATASAFREFPGISFDMKAHHEKKGSDQVPDAIFVAWKTEESSASSITAQDLKGFFDSQTAPLMNSAPYRGAHVADKLLRSKNVTGPQSGTTSSSEEVVVLRLTRMARSPQVIELLLHSPALQACRRRVLNAGYDIEPAWANGAKIFVPGILPHELQQANLTLRDCHVIVYRCDEDSMPCRDRPKLSYEQDMGRRRRPRTADSDEVVEVVCTLRTNSSFGPNSNYQYGY